MFTGLRTPATNSPACGPIAKEPPKPHASPVAFVRCRGHHAPGQMKRQYRAKQEQIQRLEAERASILERGEPTPRRLRFHLEMARVEAEELRMWGNRELIGSLLS